MSSGLNNISNIVVSQNAADQSQQGTANNNSRRKSSAKQLTSRRSAAGISHSRQKHKRSHNFKNDDMESPDDEETKDEDSDSDEETDSDEESIKSNKKRTYSRTLLRSEFLQPLDPSKDELRKRRKSLLMQRDEGKRKKRKRNSNNNSSGKGKIMTCNQANDRAIQDLAVAEIIALDGKHGSIKKVIDEYNRRGHSCVSRPIIDYRLQLLAKGKKMQPTKDMPDKKSLVTVPVSVPVVKRPETWKEVIKAFPEAKAIKDRIEETIKRDAAKELLKARGMNGGKAGSGDMEKLVRIYNAFGYKFITREAISSRATQLVGTGTYKTILTKYGIDTIYVGVESQVDPEQASKETTPDVNDNAGNDAIKTSVLPEAARNGDGLKQSDHMSDQQDDHATGATSLETEDAADANLPKQRRASGRPKGTTKAVLALIPKKEKKAQKSKLVLELTQKACEIYFAERERCKGEGIKVATGTLVKIVDTIEKENSLPAGSISWETVRSRYKNKNLTGKVYQLTPILENIEPEIMDYCVQLANLGQPLAKDQLVHVANQLVKRYNLEDEIIEFKKKLKLIEDDEDPTQKKLIGYRWHIGFCERHMADIQEKFGREFAHAGRHFHLRVEHFKSMYDLVYESMVKAGIAEKYAKPTLFDIEGGRVSHTEREWAYGLPSRYKLTKPDYILYVDQTGSKVKANRQLNFYGHVDGQMFSLPVDCSDTGIGLADEETEMKFCVYSFFNGLGETVLCAVVLKSDRHMMDIPLSVRWGIDTLKPLNGGRTELELFENNCGVGQAMQGGPVCNYKGKEVHCFVGTSADGKLSSGILLDVCKYLDEIELYDRSNGLQPFLLLDGHCSGFDVEFLDYVKDGGHQWMVSCGLPRDTHLLHVADSDEVNSSFKDEFANVKQRFLDTRMPDRKHFYPSDIIPLVHHAWSLCYSHSEGPKRALALRGWNPLNYALLLHPMLNKRGQQLSEVNKKQTPERNACV